MKLEDLKINELYIWKIEKTATIDKIISINDNMIKTQIIKSMLGNFQTGEIINYPANFFYKHWRELTPLEKLKYL